MESLCCPRYHDRPDYEPESHFLTYAPTGLWSENHSSSAHGGTKQTHSTGGGTQKRSCQWPHETHHSMGKLGPPQQQHGKPLRHLGKVLAQGMCATHVGGGPPIGQGEPGQACCQNCVPPIGTLSEMQCAWLAQRCPQKQHRAGARAPVFLWVTLQLKGPCE